MASKTLMISGSREELASFCTQLANTMDGGELVRLKSNYGPGPEIALVLEVADDEPGAGLLYDWEES